MKNNDKTGLTLVKVIAAITLFILVVQFVFSGFDLKQLTQWRENGITLMYVSVISVINMLFYSYLDAKLSWSTQGKKRAVVGVFGAVVVTVAAFFCCRVTHLVFIKQSYSFTEFWAKESISTYLFIFFLALIISLAFHVFYFFKIIQETKVKEQKIIAGTASAKFDALKNQLDPHFLFNSLNVLAALIEENPAAAQDFTTSLSKVYRYVLEQKNKELVAVEEELRFAKTYMDLLKMRFEDSIVFEMPKKIKISEARMVPLSLQLVLENAVKHNRVSEENKLRIQIQEKNGNLVVSNTLQEKRILGKGSGIGLSNIKNRYAILTDREVEIRKTQDTFCVSLPILTKKIAFVEQTNHPKYIGNMDYQRHKKARKRVQEIKGFYGNLTAYTIIIPFLFFVNYFSTGFDFMWALFPTIGWGFGVLIHYLNTFGFAFFLGKDWEEKKIRDYMDKL